MNIKQIKSAIGLKRSKKHQNGKWALDAIYCLHNEISEIAYGIAYADQTARIDGQMSIAIKTMTATQMVELIHKAYTDGIEVSGDVSRWLWQNRSLLVD